MYINDLSKNVLDLIENVETKGDIDKLEFMIYIFNLLNNNQINNQNSENPELMEDTELMILNMSSFDIPISTCENILKFLSSMYNKLTNTMVSYEQNGNVMGIEYNEDVIKLCSQFEELSFNEKLDTLSELFIRYDNETYFNKIMPVPLGHNLSGYDIAKMIKEFKI